jgi:hypothetical protein
MFGLRGEHGAEQRHIGQHSVSRGAPDFVADIRTLRGGWPKQQVIAGVLKGGGGLPNRRNVGCPLPGRQAEARRLD